MFEIYRLDLDRPVSTHRDCAMTPFGLSCSIQSIVGMRVILIVEVEKGSSSGLLS